MLQKSSLWKPPENAAYGRAQLLTLGDGIIFAAANPTGKRGWGDKLFEKAVASGVKEIPGTVGAYEIMFGDGGTSVAMAVKQPSGNNSKIIAYGGKQYPYNPGLPRPPMEGAAPYRINTHLVFTSSRPRP